MLNETSPFTNEWYWREASLFNTLKVYIEVWAENFERCETKTERKQYALMIMERIEEYNKIMKEVKK